MQTANLDPESAKTVRDLISELKKENRTIFALMIIFKGQRCARCTIAFSSMTQFGAEPSNKVT